VINLRGRTGGTKYYLQKEKIWNWTDIGTESREKRRKRGSHCFTFEGTPRKGLKLFWMGGLTHVPEKFDRGLF